MPSILTAHAVHSAAPRAKRYKLYDAHGLHLLITPNGSKLWRIDYRADGKRRTLSLGPYPLYSLDEARQARDNARKQLRVGANPTDQQKRVRLAEALTQSSSFDHIANEVLAKMEREQRAEATLTKTRWLLDFARPDLGRIAIGDITAPEILAVLRKVEARGRYESAQRLRSIIGSVFRYAIATGRASNDPTFALRGALTAPRVTHHATIIEPDEVGELLRAIDGYEGQPATHAALRLAPHVFVRPGELRMAEWAEIDFETSIWAIPAPKTKMRRALKVPLSRQSIEIFQSMARLTGRDRYVFPSLRSKERPMSDNCLNGALRRLGYDNGDMTTHGFRAMACSLLNESGQWHADAIERQLGHCDSNEVRRAYARAQYWDERVRMMQWWSDQLDTLRAAAKRRCAA
ncbi:MAG TPA: tyrosine-type recombinase/integrase [Terricaulis sp.]|nr:tyrosine-type recombinase/integrase [Terricaulis sp.]